MNKQKVGAPLVPFCVFLVCAKGQLFWPSKQYEPTSLATFFWILYVSSYFHFHTTAFNRLASRKQIRRENCNKKLSSLITPAHKI